MIRKNYKDVVVMDEEKLAHLKKWVPNFFREKNPEPISIKVKEESFYKVKKSMNSTVGSIHQANYKAMKVAPSPEDIQLSRMITEKNGETNLYSYSRVAPTSKDSIGSSFEYAFNSGNVVRIGHDIDIYPQDQDLLYYLYYYTDLFANGANPNESATYYFYLQSEHSEKEMSAIKRRNKVTSLVDALSEDDIVRILKGLFQPASESHATNYTTLYYFLEKADEAQWKSFNEMNKSVSKPAHKQDGAIANVIQNLLDADKIKLVKEVTEDFKTVGWYWKGVSDGPEADKWLKTPFAKVADAAIDERVDLAQSMANNTDKFEQLKKRQ